MSKVTHARTYLLTGAALLALGGAAPALAQTQSTAASDPAAAPSVVADPDPDTGGGQLQDIVVTATRRETNLQKTPISISVLNNDQFSG